MGKNKLANIAQEQNLNTISNLLYEKTNNLLLIIKQNSPEVEDVSLAIAELMTEAYKYLYKTDGFDQFTFDYKTYVRNYQ